MKHTRVVLAYAAGFFDGEGSITISRKDGHLRIEVACSQKYPAVLMWFKRVFGGNVYGGVTYAAQWKLHGEEGIAFLELIQSYMIVKNVDAQEAIDIWSLRQYGDTVDKLIEERKQRRERVAGRE